MDSNATVYVVDDDDAVRESVCELLRSADLHVQSYASPVEFLDKLNPENPGCAVLDVRLPDMTGLELQERLRRLDAVLPIIFITGHGDVPTAVKAIREGAIDYMEKPLDARQFVERVRRSLDLDAERRRQRAERDEIARRRQSLTPREREVLEAIVSGQPNKVVAARIGTTVRNVEYHRAAVMKKMQADSFAALVRMICGESCEARPSMTT